MYILTNKRASVIFYAFLLFPATTKTRKHQEEVCSRVLVQLSTCIEALSAQRWRNFHKMFGWMMQQLI